jgi:uncharacterized protein YjgD (DUF1641 family)
MKVEEKVLVKEDNRFEKELYKYSVSFIMPKKELVKQREKHGDAYIDFPIGESGILPDYKHNVVEIAKIIDLLADIRDDDHSEIIEIGLDCYTSPNNSYVLNKEITTKRAYGLKRYIQFLYGFDSNIFKIRGMSDDWERLEQLLLESDIAGKEELLSVIWNTGIFEGREKSFKRVRNGEYYPYIEKNMYPQLRRFRYSIFYTIHPFDTEKGEHVLKRHPEQLSQDELYQIARTYKSYTPKFNEIINLAVKLSPDDEIANLNAAALALKLKNITLAKEYLKNSKMNTSEFLNNMGVLYMLCGKYNKAWDAFKQAVKKGSNDGELNLVMLEKEKIYK